ncbi:MAG: hypothetical protein GY903_03555 [Fuerstiella sp.]|nr:hypothetical protein [Fuerstiella sp.]MCP4853551.1 hypothetical protein [Fuerstiella sp.]
MLRKIAAQLLNSVQVSPKRGRRRRKSLSPEALEPRLLLTVDVADLTVLNDEFDDGSTIENWQLVTEAEGWDAQPFETFDIDQTTPGSLTIEPHTSTWFQDYQGDLAFKEISGDFLVTTLVTINDRDEIGDSDADNIPNGSSFSLGGLMLRTPRAITDAATEWTSGGSNFVFLSMGHGYDGQMALESKNTINSDSDLELISVDSNTIELRVQREGSSVTTMYREVGAEDWQVAANFDRPDMPDTLQVGLVGYSDYGKTSTFSPEYANSNTLVETAQNSANSSNPAMAYSPDLRASFDYIRFERPDSGPTTEDPPPLVTTDVDVMNAGFEDISGENPYNEFTFGPLNGWDLYNPAGNTNGSGGGGFFIGTLAPGEVPGQPGVIQNFPGGAAEGDRVAIAFNYDGTGDTGEYGLQQTLAATLEAGFSYELSVDIGNILTGIAQSGQTFFLDGEPGYRIDLLAGETLLASDDSSLTGSIAEGEFATSVVTFDTPADHPQLGEALTIRLVNLNETALVPAGNDLEVEFDNVRLTATTNAFTEIGDLQARPGEPLVIELNATTSDGTPVEYSVGIAGAERYELDQEYDFEPGGVAADGSPLYYEEYQGYGVRWLQSNSGWMFIRAEGSLHEWQGSIVGSPEIASLAADVFADPSLLHDAIDVGTAILDGNTLTITPAESFVGTFEVSIVRTAGGFSATEQFSVDVANVAPELPEIGEQTIATDETLTLELAAVDADGDTISYEVELIENVAADFRDNYAISASDDLVASDYGYNYLGR